MGKIIMADTIQAIVGDFEGDIEEISVKSGGKKQVLWRPGETFAVAITQGASWEVSVIMNLKNTDPGFARGWSYGISVLLSDGTGAANVAPSYYSATLTRGTVEVNMPNPMPAKDITITRVKLWANQAVTYTPPAKTGIPGW